jgi:signal transduction histidine kinase
VLVRASERIKALVSELKDFARQDQEDLRERTDVNAVVRSAVSLLGPIIRKSTRRFSEAYAAELPAVRGQGRRLEQVVMNLLSNACQALRDSEKAVSVSTRLLAERGAVQIVVRDEGVGIPAENLGRITDPFFTTKHDTGGTGLGLSISRKIVERYNGTLEFTSKVNEGTAAVVTLPVLANGTTTP